MHDDERPVFLGSLPVHFYKIGLPGIFADQFRRCGDEAPAVGHKQRGQVAVAPVALESDPVHEQPEGVAPGLTCVHAWPLNDRAHVFKTRKASPARGGGATAPEGLAPVMTCRRA